MSNILYASRSKVSMVTATKKILSLVKGAFKRRMLDYRVVPNIFLCQLLFILTYVMISLRRQILIIAGTSIACFPGNYLENHLRCTHIKLIKA